MRVIVSRPDDKPDVPFIFGQSSTGYVWSQPSELDTIWACGQRVANNSILQTNMPCAPAKYYIQMGAASPWSMTSDFAETSVVTKSKPSIDLI